MLRSATSRGGFTSGCELNLLVFAFFDYGLNYVLPVRVRWILLPLFYGFYGDGII